MTKELKFKDETWDFKSHNTKYSTHGLHTYPAMMIPQIAKRLIELYGSDKKILLDPFMGSGTALLEGTLHQNFKEAYGIDINPLALLIAKVKTTPIKPTDLELEFEKLKTKIDTQREISNLKIPDFFNIEFWFDKKIIRDLAILKHHIKNIENKDIVDFFLVVFSETVRNVSFTRNREFKLYRMNEEMMLKHKPNTFDEFKKKAEKSIVQMYEYWKQRNNNCKVHILSEDSRYKTSIPDNYVDLIVTSPPYGDSRTTVAYGQFSRLALQWLDYDKETVINIDKISLGGKPTKDLLSDLKSLTLSKIIKQISEIDSTRARDVLSFYVDFNLCVNEFDRILKPKSHLCFVVGNRTVKGIQIPTDEILVELFQSKGNYKHINTFIRNIPNKRMPKKNSPTNKAGSLSSTMNEEWIVVLQKE